MRPYKGGKRMKTSHREFNLLFNLVNPARKNGGDKYEAVIEGEEKPFSIYIPQKFSRVANVCIPHFEVTLSGFLEERS